MIRGNGEGCLVCHLRVEAGNCLILPDGNMVHRDKADCMAVGGFNNSTEAGIYARLTARMSEMEGLREAYRRATGRDWQGLSPMRSGRYPVVPRPTTGGTQAENFAN